MATYLTSIETSMINFYDSLSEKDRRRYAAVEESSDREQQFEILQAYKTELTR